MDANRYLRNLGAITREQQLSLKEKRVCVVGCGGLGGYVIEHLGRLGVGHIVCVDSDCFEPTNLNRQVLCTLENLGQSKAQAAKERLLRINPDIEVTALCTRLTAENPEQILAGCHLAVDALDGIPARRALQAACARLGIPLIHGAVEGWGAQVCTIYPGEDSFSRLYPEQAPLTPPGGTLSFVVAFAASLQASEAVKALLEQGQSLRGRILFADLLASRVDILPL